MARSDRRLLAAPEPSAAVGSARLGIKGWLGHRQGEGEGVEGSRSRRVGNVTMGGSTRNPRVLQGDNASSQVRVCAPRSHGRGVPGSACQPGALRSCVSPRKSPYQRLSRRMLDISGDRGVLKDVIREGAGELVTPDASVLGIICLPAGDAKSTGPQACSAPYLGRWGGKVMF